jgi:hypothetical protein
MHEMTRLTRGLALILLAVSIGVPTFLLGCGCSWGTATEVTVWPDHECMQVDAYAHCAWLELHGTNDCEDTLTIRPVDDVEPVEVPPGESFAIDNIVPYADMETDDEHCNTDVVVRADLGDEAVTFSFVVTRINRGLRMPCD